MKNNGTKTALLTGVELARRVGCSRQSIHAWVSNGMPGANRSGLYNLKDCMDWLEARGSEKVASGEALSRKSRLIEEKLQAQVHKIRVETAVIEKEYLPASDVINQLQRVILTAKSVLLAVPSNLAGQIVGMSPAGAQELLTEAIVSALSGITEGQWPEFNSCVCTKCGESHLCSKK